MSKPIPYVPVLAKIRHQNSLGLSQWFEVVYFAGDEPEGGWRPYAGSETFGDGEQVTEWGYCSRLLPSSGGADTSKNPTTTGALLSILEELLTRGAVYPSAIEQDDYGMDFEEWEGRAKAAIARARGE